MNHERTAAKLRTNLVNRLRETGSVRTSVVALAMEAVPRELFTPGSTSLEEAYENRVVVLSVDDRGLPDSTVSQPAIVALMLEQLDVQPGMRVLEIGTGSGYNTALLAELVGPTGLVVGVEVSDELASAAARRLAGMGVRAEVRAGDGWPGVADRAPFDRIVATVGVPDLSPEWIAQLAPEGRLVAPLWLRPGVELSVAWERGPGTSLRGVSVERCGFLQLRGPHAGPGRAHPITGDLAVVGECLGPRDPDLLRALFDRGGVDVGPVPEELSRRLAGFVLDEPRAVLFVSRPDDGLTWGLFDAEMPALAVLVGDRVVCYGDRSVADALYRAVGLAPELDPGRLRLEAVPVGDDFPTPAPDSSRDSGWTLHRSAHTYRLTVC